MTRVLIAVDDTEHSVRVAETAHLLFGDAAEYLAVNVADVDLVTLSRTSSGPEWAMPYSAPFGAVWDYRPASTAVAEEAADAAGDEARAQADRSGIPQAEAVGEVGDPASTIIEAAHEHHVDVIVVGSHSRGWLDRLMSPSVSSAILKRSDVPVLLVK